MARLALIAKPRRFMVRLGRAVIVRLMARHAGRRQAVVLTAGVTLIAADLNMLTCQRELCRIVIVVCVPVVRGMARLALICEPCSLVIRFVGIIIVGKMATHTSCGQTVVLPTRVTLVAGGLNVLAR